MSEEPLLQRIIDGKLFGYVQCDSKVPEHLKQYFSNFPPIFKKTVASREDIGTLMKEYAESRNGIYSGATHESAHIKFPPSYWNANYTVAALLSGLGAGLQKKISLRSKHSQFPESVQHLVTPCREG